ncbi:MAG: ABC transporter ATP-binding protein [Roseibium sp.]
MTDENLESAISLKGISKVFPNGTKAIEGLTMDVRQGEFLSLLGPSGCGKSTVLRIVSGLMEPSDGTVKLTGSSPSKHSDDLGFVFQEPTLMPWSSAFGNVWLPLRLKGISKRNACDQVMNALEMVGLQDFADHAPHELSGGMKMRVSIARALVTRPKVLLMDEPFAALDEITRFKLNNDLLELWSTFGWTIVFVTHSVFESVYLSNRIVVMETNPGGIIADKVINSPYPRGNEFRTSTIYQDHCRDVSETLLKAIDFEHAL